MIAWPEAFVTCSVAVKDHYSTAVLRAKRAYSDLRSNGGHTMDGSSPDLYSLIEYINVILSDKFKSSIEAVVQIPCPL